MFNDNKILGVIPARGGSKGVPRKNIRNLAGKPLIAWTIETAQKSKYIDRCIVSSDDYEIMEIAKAWGGDVPFRRPQELARDDTPDVGVFLHAIEQLSGYDYIVKLQPTSPLRNVEDLDGCIEYCFFNNSKTCVSVAEVASSPYWMYHLDEQAANRMCPILPLPQEQFYQRQKLPKVFGLNGAVYIAEISWLEEHKSFVAEDTLGYIMPQERSYDIDTEMDFKIMEFIIAGNSNK